MFARTVSLVAFALAVISVATSTTASPNQPRDSGPVGSQPVSPNCAQAVLYVGTEQNAGSEVCFDASQSKGMNPLGKADIFGIKDYAWDPKNYDASIDMHPTGHGRVRIARNTWAEHCSVEDSTLAHLGGCGVEAAMGCREDLIQGNQVIDVSANGILVDGPNTEAEVPKGNRVGNNHVHACGREFYGAVGIWVGFAQGTAITHNLVHDLPYTGISVGWQWNPLPTACKENRIEYNHVYDVMNWLCDGGCIYTLGFQPGTVIQGNDLHDVHRSQMAQGAPNNGMFIDEGSKGYFFAGNVIYRTAAEFVRFNACDRDWHTWRSNYIGESGINKPGAKEIMVQAGLEPQYRERLSEKAERSSP